MFKRKKNDCAKPPENEQWTRLNDNEDDPPKRKKEWVLPLTLLLVAALGISMLPTPKKADSSGQNVKLEVRSGSPELGAVTRKLYAGGTLSHENAVAVEIPADVKIDEVLVSNGQYVAQGQPIASIDKPSAMICIRELQKRLDAMDAEIKNQDNAPGAKSITAPASARVKEIYAAPETSVLDTVYQHGMLMRLSLDGMMAVELETTAAEVGRTVTVTLSDGHEEEGRVAWVQDGITHITISDEKAPCDDTVTVKTEDGTVMGSGSLVINSELHIMGCSGTVSRVRVAEGQFVQKGAVLLSLTDTDTTAGREKLLNQRKTMEDQLLQLIQLYQDGAIRSDFDGIVSEIDEALLTNTSALNGDYVIVLLSDITDESGDTAGTDDGESPDNSTDPSVPPETEPPEQEAKPGDPSDYVNYGAIVTAVSYGQIEILMTPGPVSLSSFGNLADLNPEEMTEPTTLGGEAVVYTATGSSWQCAGLSSIAPGDILALACDGSGTLMYIVRCPGQQSDNPFGEEDRPDGGSGGARGNGGSQQPKEVIPTEPLETKTVCMAAPVETVTISVSIDEMDVPYLKEGMEAQVTLDSMPGQAFSALVDKIAVEGTNEGGSTKYEVTVTMDRTEKMLLGMSASVMLELDSKAQCLTVPSEALQEIDGKTVLYTAYDSKTDSLSNPTEVTTGLSDGAAVEILSGITADDTFYYRYADTIVYSFLSTV